MRICTKCRIEKSLDQFTTHKGNKSNFDCVHSECKECKKEYMSMLRHGISITEEKSKQNNKCAICQNQFESGKEPHIDHNHNTSEYRGILCHRCNILLGMAKII